MNDKRDCLDINEPWSLFIRSYTISLEFKGIAKIAINRYAEPYKYS